MTEDEIKHVRDLVDQSNELDSTSKELEYIAELYSEQAETLYDQALELCTHPVEYIKKATWNHYCGVCGKTGTWNPGLYGDEELHFVR